MEKNYNTEVYNLDAIIAVGYRINSKKATEFRKNNDSQESFSKVSISCLSCIYGDYHLNPYRMVVCEN